MNTKTRKRRTDTNHAIYCVTNILTGEQYVGITCVSRTVKKSLHRRMQKHTQRAMTESKNWGLCNSIRSYCPEAFTYCLLKVVREKRPAHARETVLVNFHQSALNTFGVN